jgi:hypothetical protein
VVKVAPEVPIIEIDDDDELHEIWTTEWTEFKVPQYGDNWRLVLISAILSDGILEWAIFRQYETGIKEVITHMRGDRGPLDHQSLPGRGLRPVASGA